MKPFKLFSRMFAAFSMVMMLAVSTWGETPDVGNSCVLATTVNDNSTRNNLAINPVGDKDYFKIVLTQAGTLNLSTTSATRAVVGRLYDSSCTQITSNTGSNNFSISQLLSAGTYYVSVEDSGNNQTSTYNFVSEFIVSLPTLSISPVTLSTIEGNTLTTNAIYTVTLSSAATSVVTVNYDVAGSGTAPASVGSDFTATSGMLTFAIGETTKTITVPIIGDTIGEASETYTVTLSSATNATLATATATGTITNDDAPSLSISNVTMSEGNSGTKTFAFTVTLSQSPSTAVEVDYATTNDTAAAGSDYTATSGTLRFNPNTATLQQTVNVTVSGDLAIESNEAFFLNLSNASNATISDNQGVGTIINDDGISFAANNWRLFTPVNYPGDHNMKGDITTIGNSVMVPESGGCAPTTTRNNFVPATYADIDGDSATFNSTSAELKLPVSATDKEIAWAGLYWQGYRVNRTDADKALAQQVLFKTPTSSGYVPINSEISKFNWLYVTGSAYNRFYFQGVADVTALVKAGGEGYYTVANVQSDTLAGYTADLNTLGGAFGAWSIVIVYKDSSTTVKNISVYDGYLSIGTIGATATGPVFSSYDVPLSGFLTPTAGNVNSNFLVFAGEGDAGDGTGDYTKLSNSSSATPPDTSFVSLYNPLNNADNIYNSTVTDNGVAVTNRSPNCENTIGIDIDKFAVGSNAPAATTQGQIIQTSQTRTTVRLNSSGDGYFPGVFAFSTDIYTPFISILKSTNTSGILTPNQEILYTANIQNTGNENASNIVVFDNFDDNSLSRTDGTPTDPLVTLGDLLDHNTTKMWDSIVCTYGPSNTDCKSSCTVTDTPFKISCPIPSLAVGDTAYIQFNAWMAADPDTKNQSVEVENKMYATYYNAQTGESVPQSSSNPASAGQYLYAPGVSGSVDAVSNYDANGYFEGTGLMTRIAAQQNVTVDVIWKGTGTTAANYPYTKPMPVMVSLSDSTCSTDEAISSTGYVEATLSNDGDPKATSGLFTMTSQTKENAKLRLKYIDWNNLPGGDYSQCLNVSSTLGALEGVPACINNDNNLKAAFGLAIYNICGNPSSAPRPACQSASYANGLPTAPYDSALGCFICLANAVNGPTCSSDTFAIRPAEYTAAFTPGGNLKAGNDFSLALVAKGMNNAAVTGYDGSAAITALTQISTCPVPDGNLTDVSGNVLPVRVFNGVDTNLSNNIKFGEVGSFDLNVTDSTWSGTDASKNECIANSDEATLDSNGRVGCLVRSTFNPIVIPDHFDVTTVVENEGDGFTYLSPTAQLNTMATELQVTVTAQNLSNATTRNYQTACYAKNTSYRVIYDAPLIDPVGGLTRLDFNETLTGTTGFNNPIGTQFSLNDLAHATLFTAVNPGIAHPAIRFNFNRNASIPVAPVLFNMTDLNVTDTDGVEGTDTVDRNATFLYGRADAPDYRFAKNTPDANLATYGCGRIFFEFYNPVANNPLVTSIFAGVMPPMSSSPDAGWYQNPLHDSATDGNVTGVITSAVTVYGHDVNQYGTCIGSMSGGGFEKRVFEYDGSFGYPFRSSAALDASDWLDVTGNNFGVEFYKAGEWVGEQSGTKTATDRDAETITNRRILW